MNYYCVVRPLNTFTNHTDEELLLLLKQDDESAFSELYNRHAPKVRSTAYSKLNSKEGAQEIVQDIFMSLWERRSMLHIDNLPNYLAITVKYQVINFIKKQLHVRKHAAYYKTFGKVINEETWQDVELADLHEAIEKGVRTLPEKTQVIFKLSRLEHKSIAEIAEQLNLSQKAIKYHITRSLKELRFHLREFIMCIIFLLCC